MQRFCDVFSRNNQLTIDLAATTPELMVDLRIINNSAWIIMDLYWFIRLLFTKEASCRQIIALCQTFSSQYCVGDRRANRKMCVVQYDIWIFLKRVTCTGIYDCDCPVSKCWYYAAHALHQHSTYISCSFPHFTPQNSLLKTSDSSRPGLAGHKGRGHGHPRRRSGRKQETGGKGRFTAPRGGEGQGVN